MSYLYSVSPMRNRVPQSTLTSGVSFPLRSVEMLLLLLLLLVVVVVVVVVVVIASRTSLSVGFSPKKKEEVAENKGQLETRKIANAQKENVRNLPKFSVPLVRCTPNLSS